MPTFSSQKSTELLLHWLVCATMLLLLLAYNIICHFWADQIRINLEESQRILVRTIFYAITIGIFPLTNLIRHILLRLNQTMPGEKTAEQRYLLTIIVTQSIIESVSLFGLTMYMLGDDFNTLYIFSLLGTVGIYLHRPQQAELLSIVQALSVKEH